MKEFFRSVLGSCLGVLVAMLVVFLVFIGIGVAASAGGGTKKTAENGVLKLSLSDVIPEKTDNVEKGFMDRSTSTIGLRDMLRLIDHAAENSEIKGIVINASDLQVGQATLLQLREALEGFKSSKKFVYAYADNYSQGSYILSSVADSLFLNPNGGVDLHGYGTVTPFFKNTLDKLGINFNVFYAGDFKSATEPLRRNEMSPENRLQTAEFLDGMLDIMKEKVSKSRKITLDAMDKIMNTLDGRNAILAKRNGLIDNAIYQDQFESKVRKAAKVEESDKINYLSMNDYNTLAALTESGSYKNKIAVVYAEGEVSYNNPQKGVIDNKQFLKIFDQIKRDDNIKAVVLRVNSGGGSALTSDIIWRELENIKKSGIPVIASFGDYAASGGYYIAAGADSIVAAPNTLTGSIGVFSMFPNFKKFMNDKMGITFDTVKTHNYAVNLSSVYNLSDYEMKIMTESTDDIYKQFLQRVADGRGMTVDDVHKIAQGRVWTGVKAKELGLVDAIGFLNDAIKIAAKKAKLEDYKIVEYPKIKKDMWQELFANIARSSSGEDDDSETYMGVNLNKESKLMYDLYNKYKIMLESEGVQARMTIDVKF
jgi:protease IV